MRPRKKAKEANLSICKYLDEQETKPDIEHKEEPMSPDYKPDLANFHIKKSASPIDEPKVKLSPSSSPQTIVKDDVMLSSITNNNTCSDTDYIPQSSDKTQETCTIPHASNETSMNSDDLNEKENSAISDLANDDLCQDGIDHDDLCQDGIDHDDLCQDGIDHDDLCQDGIDLDDQGDLGNMADNEHGEACSISETVGNMLKNTSNISDNNSTIDYTNSTDSSNNDSNIPDSNVPDDLHPDPQNDQPTSPISPSVDNAKNIMENINLQKQELCAEEESVGVNGHSSEAQSTLADTSTSSESHKHDCGAEACTSNGASSTVCLCTNEEKSKKETSLERFGSTEASELLDGLRAAGFVPLVRQLLENVQGDTRLSQMETELNTLGNQISQKRKANRQLQKSIKKKAGELEKLFDNLRKGKAHCEMLEQKHKALQSEKAIVEAKVKKCLEVLNSVD